VAPYIVTSVEPDGHCKLRGGVAKLLTIDLCIRPSYGEHNSYSRHGVESHSERTSFMANASINVDRSADLHLWCQLGCLVWLIMNGIETHGEPALLEAHAMVGKANPILGRFMPETVCSVSVCSEMPLWTVLGEPHRLGSFMPLGPQRDLVPTGEAHAADVGLKRQRGPPLLRLLW